MSARRSTYLASAAFWLLLIGVTLAMRAGTANADSDTGGAFYTYIESYWHATAGSCHDCATIFHPYGDTTRGQLAKIIVLASCWPIYTPPQPTFDDVPASNPFYEYIETAYDKGIISGYA